MKVYSIGREVGNNIVLDDRTDVISRRHATLNVDSSGNMTITDQSANGTYVNGIRISSGVPVPVTRKDNISFAHVARLDWNLIPNPRAAIDKWVGIAATIIVVLGAGLWFLTREPSNNVEPQSPEPPQTTYTEEDVNKKVKEGQEARAREVRDSLLREEQKRDSIREKTIQKAQRTKPTQQPKRKQTKKPTQASKPQQPQPTRRVGR